MENQYLFKSILNLSQFSYTSVYYLVEDDNFVNQSKD